MRADGADSLPKLGLLGSWPDPVAQLLEDLYHDDPVDFVQVLDPESDLQGLDEVIVLSLAHALAHMRALVESQKPCRIVLRRRGPLEETQSWRTGIEWFAEALRIAPWQELQLVALTPAAASELAKVVGREVTPIGSLAKIATKRPTVAIPRYSEYFTFSAEGIDGTSGTRRAMVDIYNWTRLRRLAHMEPEDPDDLDMRDLCDFANGTAPGDAAQPNRSTNAQPCVLCVVPNGIGLGHVTRMLAVAKALQQEGNARVIFWSFSRAAEILQAAGFEVLLRQNVMHLSAHPPDWRLWETLEFASAIRQLRPTAICYDGGSLDMFMIDALRTPGCGRCGIVWVRRGMLHPDSDAQLLEAEQYADIVLEPGDLSVEMDFGPTRMRQAQNRGFSRQVLCPPVVLKQYLPSYDRKAARKRLGLRWGRHCLVSLGGEFGNWDTLRMHIIELAKRNRVKLIWAQSPLAAAASEDLGDTIVRQFYPLSRYLSAFDGMITATGYNSFHELMLGYDGPVLLAPTNNVRMDDQVARASFADQQGWASVVYPERPDEQFGTIERFMMQVRDGEKIGNRPDSDKGAPAMAREILAICQRYM